MGNELQDEIFTIGVAGHRNLPSGEIVPITQAVRKFFADSAQSYGASAITVLSPMAEGADMLCAKIALDMNLRLVAALPMPVSEYRKDFSGSQAAEFDCLLSMADEVLTVQPIEPVPVYPMRGFWYRQAGIYLAKSCSVLLTVWDGARNDTADGAGTWETVKLAQQYGKPVHRVSV